MLGKQIIETAISKNSDINAGGDGSHLPLPSISAVNFLKTYFLKHKNKYILNM
jgi:hypothetical protein